MHVYGTHATTGDEVVSSSGRSSELIDLQVMGMLEPVTLYPEHVMNSKAVASYYIREIKPD
jgi:hypothetical protein